MKPFRWSIAKREQLGSLIDGIEAPSLSRDGFIDELRRAAARVIAFADDADLAFIGRTPENFFDYLSGSFAGIADAPQLHLVHFSLRSAGDGGVHAIAPERLSAFFDYLAAEGVDPASIAAGGRPLALVDFVARGGTFANLVALLKLHAQRDRVDWNAVQRRLRLIGLTLEKHTSPNTWRWHQHQDWLNVIPDARVKNVSVPAHIIWHLANDQQKVTQPHHPGRWDREGISGPGGAGAVERQALAFAAKLYDRATTCVERARLAAEITALPEMRQAATRRLVLRLRG